MGLKREILATGCGIHTVVDEAIIRHCERVVVLFCVLCSRGIDEWCPNCEIEVRSTFTEIGVFGALLWRISSASMARLMEIN